MTKTVAGMRGGLGRVLLTALMLLAIVPLGVVSYVAIRRVQSDLRQTVLTELDRLATSKELQFRAWLETQGRGLTVGARSEAFRLAVQRQEWTSACQVLADARPGTATFSLTSADQAQTLCTTGDPRAALDRHWSVSVPLPVGGDEGLSVSILPPFQELSSLLDAGDLLAGEHVLLVNKQAMLVAASGSGLTAGPGSVLHSQAIDAALQGQQGSAFYEDPWGDSVVGVYRWLPDVEVVLLVEASQETALSRGDDLAAMLIGSTLVVALLTTLLAAVFTRRLTQPIVELTVSAVKIANGDLDQAVDVARRDELGILAQAFNIMSGELRSLYDGLESKVARRTLELVAANQQLRYQPCSSL